MKEKRFIFAFGFFITLSISYSQSISFTNPSNGEVFNLGEIVEIEWEVSNLRGSIDIEYSTDKNKWNLITQISALICVMRFHLFLSVEYSISIDPLRLDTSHSISTISPKLNTSPLDGFVKLID